MGRIGSIMTSKSKRAKARPSKRKVSRKSSKRVTKSKRKQPKRKVKKLPNPKTRSSTSRKRASALKFLGQKPNTGWPPRHSSPKVQALAWVAGRGLSKEGLRCIPWHECTRAQKIAMERLRREAFPGDRGDVTTCQEWASGKVGPIPGLDFRDRPLLKNAVNHTVMVALRDKDAVGYACWLDYKNWCSRRCTFLGYLAVKKSHRLQGVGRFLMNQFSDRGTRLNLEGVLNATQNATGFYAKMGWRMCAQEYTAAPGFDMGHPERIVGRLVRFKFKDKKWYEGEIKEYSGGPYYNIYVPSIPTQNLARYHVEKDILRVKVLK